MAKPLTLDDLKPDPKNARAHGARNLEVITSSVKAFGPARSIVIDEADQVLAGHGTIEGAKRNGIRRVIVVDQDKDAVVSVRVTGLSSDEKAAYALADNRSAELASWVPEVLAAHQKAGLDLAGLWTDDDLAAVLGVLARKGPDPDVAPARPVSTRIKPGQRFALDRHRLVCGDARHPEVLAALMGDDRARLYHTDPPYGVAAASTKKGMRGFAAMKRLGELKNDELTGEPFRAFLAATFRAVLPHLADGCPWYLWHASTTGGDFLAALESAEVDLVVHRTLIWRKPRFVLTRSGMYHWAHEPAFYGWRQGAPPRWLGDKKSITVWEIAAASGALELCKLALESGAVVLEVRAGGHLSIRQIGSGRKARPREVLALGIAEAQRRLALDLTNGETTVWDLARDLGKAAHPTRKPVEIFRRAMRNHCRPGDVVLDTFAGSGSQVIAAEELGLACRAVELDPRYVDVIIERWQSFTGQKAKRLA